LSKENREAESGGGSAQGSEGCEGRPRELLLENEPSGGNALSEAKGGNGSDSYFKGQKKAAPSHPKLPKGTKQNPPPRAQKEDKREIFSGNYQSTATAGSQPKER